MQLDEAKEILNKAGYLLEGSMSLEDKIANAKKFNDQSSNGAGAEIKRIVYDSNLLPAVKQAVYKSALEHAEDRDQEDLADYIEWLENGTDYDHEPGIKYIAVTDLCFATPAAAELYNELMAENSALDDLKFKFGTRSTTYSSPQDHVTKPISMTEGNLYLFDGNRCVVSHIIPQHGDRYPNKFKSILRRNIFKTMTKEQVIRLCKEYQYDN